MYKYFFINQNFINMKNKPKILDTSFGKRLASVRKSKGITQVELAKKVKTTQRVIAYYEGETDHIPTNLLVPIAKALRVSVDELVGLKKESISSSKHASLWRKLKKAEHLSHKDQKAVIHYIEALLAKS